MEFTLTYSGPLKASGSVKEKHELRQHFHNQLLVLWSQIPLCELTKTRGWLFSDKYVYSMVNCINNFKFLSLITSKQNLIAELRVTLLRPEPPGQIVTQCGDIDNRLKTLLDALRIPKDSQEIPKEYKPKQNEIPFFHCLLEDDNLITRLSIETDRLLETPADSSFVKLLIHVKSKVISQTDENLCFI